MFIESPVNHYLKPINRRTKSKDETHNTFLRSEFQVTQVLDQVIIEHYNMSNNCRSPGKE